jgi:hypothetical protein
LKSICGNAASGFTDWLPCARAVILAGGSLKLNCFSLQISHHQATPPPPDAPRQPSSIRPGPISLSTHSLCLAKPVAPPVLPSSDLVTKSSQKLFLHVVATLDDHRPTRWRDWLTPAHVGYNQPRNSTIPSPRRPIETQSACACYLPIC